MIERPPKLSPLAVLVVWAAHRLTLAEKVVWYRDWTLDRGGQDGAYASAKGLSASLGDSVSPSSVETIRSRLGKIGLQHRFTRREGRNPGRVCILPDGLARPRTASEALKFAADLDRHLDALARGPTIENSMGIEERSKAQLDGGQTRVARAPSGGDGGVSSQDRSETPIPSLLTAEKGSGVTPEKLEKRTGNIESAGAIAARYLRGRTA